MRGIFLTTIFLWIGILGFSAPYVFILGYIWVDIFTPQRIAYSILPSIPVAFIYALAAAISILTINSKQRGNLGVAGVLILIFAAWMTTTLIWAAVPEAAIVKWTWAVKSVAFAALVPLFFRTREQVEALIWTIVISGIAHCIPFGAKVLISGGGYGSQMGLVQANNGYGEGSTLAMIAVTLVPMCIYLLNHQQIIPYKKITKLMLMSFIAFAILTSVGTFARTGLISFAVLCIFGFIATKRKLQLVGVVVAAGFALNQIAGEQWKARMNTIGDGSEGSAMGRVAVWKWTLEYISTHPWGGSFDVYRINSYAYTMSDGNTLTIAGKAFHSIYFEILGETGIPGLVMFLAIMMIAFINFKNVIARGTETDSEWLVDLAKMIRISLVVTLAGGAFVGIGFQGYLYYLVGISTILISILSKGKASARQ